MFGKTPRGDKPAPPPAPADKRPARPRDLAREDADSPSSIPVLPPRGDGS